MVIGLTFHQYQRIKIEGTSDRGFVEREGPKLRLEIRLSLSRRFLSPTEESKDLEWLKYVREHRSRSLN